MSFYYCPFCSSHSQSFKTRSDGLLICGQCGDELIRAPSVKMTQVVGLICASAFLVPLVLMVAFVLKDLHKQKIHNSSNQIAFVSVILR